MNLKYYLRGLGIGIVVTAIIMGAATAGQKERLSDAEIKARAAELGMVEEGGLLSDLEATPIVEVVEKEAPEEAPEEAKEPEVAETPKALEEPEATEKPEVAETPKETKEPKATEKPEVAETPKATKEPEATEKPEVAETPEETKEPKATEKPKATEAPKATKEPKATEAPKEAEKTKLNSDDKVVIEVVSGDSSYTICKKLEEKGLIASASAFDTYLCENGVDKKLKTGSYEIPGDATPEEIAKLLAK